MNYSKVVRSVPPFAGASDDFIVEVAGTAAVKLYGPGEGITFQGERKDPFYIHRKVTLWIHSKSIFAPQRYVPWIFVV